MRRIACLIVTADPCCAAHRCRLRAQSNLPPHAWLFGAWTGGLFPPPSTLSAQECLAQPVVIFTRDIVMRAVITDQTLCPAPGGDRARHGGRGGIPLRPAGGCVAGGSVQPRPSGGTNDVGFGCASPDVLHVQRRGENEISFPGCNDFPYPLVRCSGPLINHQETSPT